MKNVTPGPSLPTVHDTGGRPAYSDAVRAKVIAALKIGMTRRAASGTAGIHHDTLYEWMKADPAFKEACETAENYAEGRFTRHVSTASARGSVRASVEWLKRRRPNEWRERITVDSSSAEDLIAEEADRDDTRIERLQQAIDEARRRRAEFGDRPTSGEPVPE